MNKQALLEQTYNSAFQDELEKIAEESGTHAGTGALVGAGLAGADLIRTMSAGKKARREAYKNIRSSRTIPRKWARQMVNPTSKLSLAANAAQFALASGGGAAIGSLFKKKNELDKISALDINHLENQLGGYLNDSQEEVARDLIEQQKDKRFALRHPFLTGLPTLGIAPAISKANASREILKAMSNKDSIIADLIKAQKQREHELDVAYMGSPVYY